MRSPITKKLVLIFATILILSAGCNNTVEKNNTNTMQAPYTQKLQVGQNNIYVEVVNTDASRAQGLSGREKLSDQQGMLFDFKNTGITNPGFWMKDMKFDLDFIWIQNGKIIGITKNVPAPLASGATLPLYYPPSPTDAVLEVDAGWSDGHNVKVGDEAKLIE